MGKKINESIQEETTDLTLNLDQATMLFLFIQDNKVRTTNRERGLIEEIESEVKEAIIYLQKNKDATIKLIS